LEVRHFLTLKDLSRKKIQGILKEAFSIKKNPLRYKSALKGKSIGLLFEKPSLRTRVSSEIGLVELGAHSIYLSPLEVQLGKREAAKDISKTLSGYLDGVIVRT